MKTVKRGIIVKRVSDGKAQILVRNQEWKYCPKSEWKAIRDGKPIPTRRR